MTNPPATTSDSLVQVPKQSGGMALIQSIRFLCMMAVSAAIFWYVGWRVVQPADPAGPVTLLLVNKGVVAMAELLGLAIVTSGLAVAFCGPGSADRGPLAIAVGLATLGLRGAEMDMLVLFRMTPPPTEQGAIAPFPAWELIAECWLWIALICVGFVVGRWVDSWHKSAEPAPSPASAKAAADQSPDFRQGLGAMLISALVAWGVLSFASGTETHSFMTGQIYFSVGFGFLLGSLVANGFFKGSSRVWLLVSIGIVAAAAYVMAGPSPEAISHALKTKTYLNIRPIARPLPLEYAAMGAIGVLLKDDAMALLRSLFGLQPEPAKDSDA